MQKTLLIAGAILLATAGAASAQSYYGGYGYRGYYGSPRSYADFVRQMRACREHARLHRELDVEHAEEHAQGLEGPGDHRDLHEDLDEAHDAYHADHPRADLCNSYGYDRPVPYRYGRPYVGYGYGNPYSGMSFGFSYGR